MFPIVQPNTYNLHSEACLTGMSVFKSTKRLFYIYVDGQLLANLRPLYLECTFIPVLIKQVTSNSSITGQIPEFLSFINMYFSRMLPSSIRIRGDSPILIYDLSVSIPHSVLWYHHKIMTRIGPFSAALMEIQMFAKRKRTEGDNLTQLHKTWPFSNLISLILCTGKMSYER